MNRGQAIFPLISYPLGLFIGFRYYNYYICCDYKLLTLVLYNIVILACEAIME